MPWIGVGLEFNAASTMLSTMNLGIQPGYDDLESREAFKKEDNENTQAQKYSRSHAASGYEDLFSHTWSQRQLTQSALESRGQNHASIRSALDISLTSLP